MTVRHILLCCLLTVLTPLSGVLGAVQDSLLMQIESMPHDTTHLAALNNLVTKYQSDPEKGNLYNDRLIEEAKEQNNARYLCQAYMTQLANAYNSYDTERVKATFELLEPIARRGKFYDLLFRGWRCCIDLMVLSQDYERNEKEALRMLAEAEKLNSQSGILEAYQCLATIYQNTFREQEAIDILEKARAIALEYKDPSPIINIYRILTDLYRHDSKNGLRTLRQFEHYVLSLDHATTQEAPTLLLIYSHYLYYYTQLEDWEQAEKYRLIGEQYYAKVTSPLYRIVFNTYTANYYSAQEKYEEALQQMQISTDMVHKLTTGTDYYTYLHRQAKLLYVLERSEEALALYKQVYAFKDNLQVETINKQYEQLRGDFDAAQLFIEQGKIRHRMQVYTVILLALGFLVVIYLVASLLRSSRILRRAEREMREMTDRMEQANEAKDRFLSNISTAIRVPLNTVVEGSLRIASHQTDSPEQRQQLSDTIRKMSSGLLEMINDILDLSRLEAGMMRFDLTDVEITSSILNTITATQNQDANLRISTELPDDALYMIRADKDRLQQVLTALLSKPEQEDGQLSIKARKEEGLFRICIAGTALAQKDPAQEIIIRNEINRMLIGQFGGSYEIINQDDDKKGNENAICFSLPITEVIRPD